MLKMVSSVVIVVCCSMVGVRGAHNLVLYCRLLEHLIMLTDDIADELRLTMAPCREIIYKLCGNPKYEKLEWLRLCAISCDNGSAFPVAWEKSVRSLEQNLKPDAFAALREIGAVLGSSDLQGQLAGLHGIRRRLEFCLEGAREKEKTHYRLYCTMGVLCGLFIVFIII